jgi:hypothetical protein
MVLCTHRLLVCCASSERVLCAGYTLGSPLLWLRGPAGRVRRRRVMSESIGSGSPQRPATVRGWSVVWTRGEGCAVLAQLLAEGEPHRASSDLAAACLAARADLLVMRRLTSFDLVDTAAPYHLVTDGVASVVAAIGGGPHSMLAAVVAGRLAASLEVGGSLVSASPEPRHDEEAAGALDRVASQVPELESRLVRAESARALVRTFPPNSLLVVGAPGGSWLQRQFFGPGRQLVVGAGAGAVVVRSAPRSCFQQMAEPYALGPQMKVAEARRLAQSTVVPVASDGALVGIVRVRSLQAVDGSATIESVMEDPVFVRFDDPLESAGEVGGFLEGSPIPVVDSEGRLCGMVAP